MSSIEMNQKFLPNFFVFASPIFVVVLMLGAALMQNNIAMFLIYYSFLLAALVLRFLLFMLAQNRIKQVDYKDECSSFVVFPFPSFVVFEKLGLSLFVFLFTIAYVFLPSWFSQQFTSSSISFFLFLILYMVFDSVMREYLIGCFSSSIISLYARIFRILSELIISLGMAFLSLFILQKTSMGKYMYFSSSSLFGGEPKKRTVFRCGKINR